jgi:quercetin dioxygenase-like cupin family protein
VIIGENADYRFVQVKRRHTKPGRDQLSRLWLGAPRSPAAEGERCQTKRMRKQLLLSNCVVLLLAGCQHSENRYLHRQVNQNELVGRFVGTPFAMESLKYAGFRSHLNPAEHDVVLRTDGTCTAQTVVDPTLAVPEGEANWVPAGAPCRWALGSDGRHQQVLITVALQGDSEKTLPFYLDEADRQLVLWRYAGDPDAWKYMELKKAKTAG